MSSVESLREQIKLLEQQDALQRQIAEQKAILDEQEDARKAPLDARSKGFKASQRASHFLSKGEKDPSRLRPQPSGVQLVCVGRPSRV